MLAAQIQNLPPTPVPPVPVVAAKPKKRRRGGIGDLPESNLYDALERDYLDEEAVAHNAEVELAGLAKETQDFVGLLADELGVEVIALQTQVVVASIQSAVAAGPLEIAATGVPLGQLDTDITATAPSVSVEPLDAFVFVDVPGDDDGGG